MHLSLGEEVGSTGVSRVDGASGVSPLVLAHVAGCVLVRTRLAPQHPFVAFVRV